MSDNSGIGIPAGKWDNCDVLEDTPDQAAKAFVSRGLCGPFRLVVMKKEDAIEFFNALEALGHWAADPRDWWTVSVFGEWDARVEHPTWGELEQWAL
jgi:hypothetical protein